MRTLRIFCACTLTLLILALPLLLAGASSIGIIGGASGATAVFIGRAEEADISPTPTPEPTAAPVENMDMAMDVTMGYGGLVIMSNWSPMFVTVTNNGPDFDGLLGVNVFRYTTTYDRYETPLTLATGATKQVMLPIQSQTRQDMYAFELVQDGAIVAEKRVAPTWMIAPETVAVGVLSEEPEQFAYMAQRASGLDTLRGEVWRTVPLSPETFPQSLDLMNAFSILVVDGVDARLLGEEQQEALAAWIQRGGIVFVSGGAKAAADYPFFAQWTGQSDVGISESEDITPLLLGYTAVSQTPAGMGTWLNPLSADNALIQTADRSGVINQYPVGDGLVFLAAFDMGGKPFTTWSPMQGFWPRLLRTSASATYERMIRKAEESRYGSSDSYRVRELVTNMSVPNEQSGIPVVLILGAYLLLAGFGGYWILKRLDRREWLWVTAPACAAVFAALLALLSQSSAMNDPVGLTASRVVIEDGDARVSTYLGVATPESGELLIQTDQDRMVSILSDEGYWYDDGYTGTDRVYRPIDLVQRYRFGDTPAIGFTVSGAWDVKMLSLSEAKMDMDGSLEGRIWIDEDGMRGEVTNTTDYLIHDAFIVTSVGYSDVGDVLPGETAEFALLYPDQQIDPYADNFKVQPNVLYSNFDMNLTSSSGYYGDMGLYTYLNAAIYRGEDYDSSPEAVQRQSLVNLFDTEYSFYQSGSTGFYLFGFNDALGKVEVSINEKTVGRTAHTAVLGSRVTFEPVGPTGQVMFPQGTIQAEVMVDQGENEKPRMRTEADVDPYTGYYMDASYVSLASVAAVRFMLPQWGTYTVDKMTLAGMTYETVPEMFLYNNETRSWYPQLLLTVTMDGEDWKPYIDRDGCIYVRYVPAETAGRYESMSRPTIALKGEVTQ